MSFILDALKKSEAERNRQAGPTLYEMRAAPRRAPLPTWVAVIGVVLVLNLAGLGYLLLRRQAPTPVSAPVSAAPVSAAPVATPPAPAATPALEPLSIRTEAADRSEPQPVATASAGAAPATAMPSATSPPVRAAARAVEGRVASLAEMAASGANLPELRLALHAYDSDGARRFILLNGLRLREGESTPDGLQVERIVEDGTVLSWRGRRFMLPRGE